MRALQLTRRSKIGVIALAIAAIGGISAARVRASDHQDTPDVELNPSYDMTDVYAFPSATPGRIVLVLNSWAFLTPAQTPGTSFDNNLLYQFKIDNSGDAVEDKVIQVTFSGSGATQQVKVVGPIAPPVAGPMGNKLSTAAAAVTGTVRTNLGSATGMQVFAGAREDPFFIDLEAFFRVLPDRKPVGGPLAGTTQGPLAFRSAATAIDFPKGQNVLAIVVELPADQLYTGGNRRIGVWGTISR